MSEPLFLRAARCYAGSGWLAEAGRCFERAGRPLEAARLYEQRGEWTAAARAYGRAGEWAGAARCHLRAGEPEAAVECLERAGQRIEAAWLLADTLHRFARARALVEPLAPEAVPDVLRRETALARCEAGAGEARAAAVRLRGAIRRLGEHPAGPGQTDLADWMLAVARSLGRTDLEALVHAAAYRAGAPGAAERWERWALATLGDASGVPVEGEVAEEAGRHGGLSGPRSDAGAVGGEAGGEGGRDGGERGPRSDAGVVGGEAGEEERGHG